MILNTRISFSLCALLAILTPAVIEAVPEKEKKPAKIEGTANPEKFPAKNPDEALLSTITYPAEMKAGVFARQPDILNATAICFDEQNRLYASETHRFDRGIEDNRRNQHWLRDEIALTSTAERLGMYKKHADIKPLSYYTEYSDKIRVLEDTNGDGKADVSKIFADEFNDPLDGTAAGIMAANGKVYYACIPHVWMLEDNNGDLIADKRTSLQEGYGISVSLSGHDLNGFAFGPDGRIYFTLGDRGYNLKTADGRHLYDQYAGAIFRMEPDGSGLEVVHYGLRNPKEIAFDQYGEAFSVDNNADMGDKARIVHIVEGATSGWHRGNQNLRNFRHAIDVNGRHEIPWMEESGWDVKGKNRPAAYLPPTAHLSTGPSGLTYNPGTGLDPKWANNFFICDYRGAKSGVIAFEMKPSGASFALEREETFIQGFLNTDMEFGYDGKVYVSDFTGSWRTYDLGTIFVFENEKETAKPIVAEVRSLFANDIEKLAPEKLASLLGHTDMRVRQRAQFALAKDTTNRPHLLKATDAGNKLVHRLHGLWGLGQLARSLKDLKSAQALAKLTMDSEWRIRSQAAKALGDSFPKEFQSTAAFLLKDKHPNTQLHAAIALGKSKNPQYIPALISLLEKNKDADVYLRHGAIQGLIGIADVDASIKHAKGSSPAVRRGLVIALRRLKSDQLATFVTDPDPSIAIEAIQAINDDYIEGARSAVARATNLLGKSSTMIDNRILNSIYRMGDEENARRALGIATNSNYPESIRMEALFVLQRWENPPAADPTTGKHRPLTNERSLAKLRPDLTKTLNLLLDSCSGALLAEVIRTTEGFGIEITPATLLTHFANSKNATAIRLAALETLLKNKEDGLRPLLDKTLKDRDREIRAKSFETLASLDPVAAVTHAKTIFATGQIFDKQRAFAALEKLPNAAGLILTKLKDLKNQAPAIHLDILDAAAQRSEPEIKKALVAYKAGLDSSNPFAAYAVTADGGDINQGRSVFYNHGAAQCTRCHKGQKGRKGGVAGPNLQNVGSIHNRTYLVDSIVNPGAHIAPGYGTVSLTLNNDDIVAGTLTKENAKQITLKDLANGESKTYPRSEIKEISQAMSTMPPMIGILKKSEIRDLVAYLASLKAPK